MYHKLNKCLNSRSSYQSCSMEKLFLKFLQYSQENTCVRVVELIDLWASRPATFLKRHSDTGVFM